MQAHPVIVAVAAACLLCGGSAAQERPAPLGIFDGQSDIGSVVPPGTAQYRTTRGANTQDIELNIPMPRTVRPEKRGDTPPARPLITGVSHIAVYAADPAKSERFYVHDLGAVKGSDPENPHGMRYYFAPTQFVEVLPIPSGPPSINRLDHVAFITTDAPHLLSYLAAKHVTVPERPQHGDDGSTRFDVLDPEGNRIEFVQPPEHPPDIAVNSLSHHMIHVGFIVHSRVREDGLFRSVLGFRPYWFGGMKEDVPSWISQQVPDGTDWLEYMVVGSPEGRGIPPTLGAADLGVLDHFSLGVNSAEAAYTLLWNGDRLMGQNSTPKIGRDAKWQLNLLDPDGTRAELMELHAIGKPCCSAFTASDPQE
jgi:catechol 2,3-dioxygenase-like lactoylglutathione lyase family enzyme